MCVLVKDSVSWEIGILVALKYISIQYSSFSHLWNHWHLSPDNFLFGSHPACCRMCSSIPGLYPLDASQEHALPISRDNPKCLQGLWNVSEGAKSPPVEKFCSRGWLVLVFWTQIRKRASSLPFNLTSVGPLVQAKKKQQHTYASVCVFQFSPMAL